MFKLVFCVLLLLVSCVAQIEREGTPSCCQSLYDVIYLNQKAKLQMNVNSLLDCCRKQQKIEFCMEHKELSDCVNMMKTF